MSLSKLINRSSKYMVAALLAVACTSPIYVQAQEIRNSVDHVVPPATVQEPQLPEAPNILSRPVGFVRATLPTNSRTIASIPFEPFDPSVSAVFRRQLVGPTNVFGTYEIMRWDRPTQKYISIIKAHGLDDEDANERWYDDLESLIPSDAQLLPGEAFWLENASDRSHDVFLCGRLSLEETASQVLFPGLNLFGSSFPSELQLTNTTPDPLSVSGTVDGADVVTCATDVNDRAFLLEGGDTGTSAIWVDSDGYLSSMTLHPGKGYWYECKLAEKLEWAEYRPFDNIFPAAGTPDIVSMHVNKPGDEIGLVIECTGETGERIDIFYADISPTGRFDAAVGWKLADTIQAGVWAEESANDDIPPAIAWRDGGMGLSQWPKVNRVFGRCYLAARADIDTDDDGIPDARELLVYGTDPSLADTDGDGMPDDYELGHGLDATVNDAKGDLDGDGKSNAAEYLAGTDPRYSREHNVTLYVDEKTGDDSSDGLAALADGAHAPKESIDAAIKASIPGDKIVVLSGSYSEGGLAIPSGVTLVPAGKITVH